MHTTHCTHICTYNAPTHSSEKEKVEGERKERESLEQNLATTTAQLRDQETQKQKYDVHIDHTRCLSYHG